MKPSVSIFCTDPSCSKLFCIEQSSSSVSLEISSLFMVTTSLSEDSLLEGSYFSPFKEKKINIYKDLWNDN